MAIQQNDTQYQEESIDDLCDGGKSSEIDVLIAYLLENNNNLNEVRLLKREHEMCLVRLYEVIE